MQNKYELKSLNKIVDDKFILKDINISFKKGLNVIIGQSGAGKSTLLNILGFIDDSSNGEIHYRSTDINSMPEKEKEKFRAEQIGFVCQNC